MTLDAAAFEPRGAPSLPTAPQLQDGDAVEIGKLYRKGNQSIIDAARFHIECGQLLAKKKRELGHGHWLPWLTANANVLGGLTPRTAQLLMKAAAKYEVNFVFDDIADAKRFHRELWNNSLLLAQVNSGNDEWFTCDRELDLVRAALGGSIDLDPASCDAAQLRVQAKRFYTKADNGLKQRWLGTVFVNPPYSLLKEFTKKLIKEYRAGHTTAAVMLTPASTSTEWFQKAGRNCDLLCLSNGRRVHFINADGKVINPAQGHTFIYFGERLQLFSQTFSGDIGFIVGPAKGLAHAS
jgi:hypothetical protein